MAWHAHNPCGPCQVTTRHRVIDMLNYTAQHWYQGAWGAADEGWWYLAVNLVNQLGCWQPAALISSTPVSCSSAQQTGSCGVQAGRGNKLLPYNRQQVLLDGEACT